MSFPLVLPNVYYFARTNSPYSVKQLVLDGAVMHHLVLMNRDNYDAQQKSFDVLLEFQPTVNRHKSVESMLSPIKNLTVSKLVPAI
jgi:hypothetical protein